MKASPTLESFSSLSKGLQEIYFEKEKGMALLSRSEAGGRRFGEVGIFCLLRNMSNN